MSVRYLLGLPALAFAAAAGGDLWWNHEPDFRLITSPIERGDLTATILTTGELSAVTTVAVGSQQSGQIAELMVDFNDRVKKGQPIARLDPSAFSAKVREAEAALEEARANVAITQTALEKAWVDLQMSRTKREVASAQVDNAKVAAQNARLDLKRKQVLVERATVAPAVADDASAAYRSASALLRAAEAESEGAQGAVAAAQASLGMAEATLRHAQAAVKQRVAILEQAKIDLERTVIRSPIDGEVIARSVDPGQTVAATLEAPTLFTIAQDLRKMEVHAKIDEADIGRIRVGQHATFTVDALPEREFAAIVSQIRKAPEVIENVVTYTVALRAENADMALLPGMTAVVEVVVDRAEGVLKVPNAATRFRPETGGPLEATAEAHASGRSQSAIVWVKGPEDEPRPVQVALGRSDGTASELVAGGLSAGDEVIVGKELMEERASWLGLAWGR
jgi:HlyD family secretion protein